MGPVGGFAAICTELLFVADSEEEKPRLLWLRVIVSCAAIIAAAVSVSVSEKSDASSNSTSPEEGDEHCSLIGNAFAWLVQFALLTLVVAVLIYKRYRESPRRTWAIWLMDTSKQGVSSGAAHACGIMNSLILAHFTDASEECGWYFASYTVDTTFGVYCAITFLQAVERVAKDRNWISLQHTGVYPNSTVFLKQLVAFTMMVVVARMCCAVVLCALIVPLHYAVAGLCSAFDGHPHGFLVTVMVGGPGLMNAAQVWVQDNFLKRKEDDDPHAASNSLYEGSLDTQSPNYRPPADDVIHDADADDSDGAARGTTERSHMIP